MLPQKLCVIESNVNYSPVIWPRCGISNLGYEGSSNTWSRALTNPKDLMPQKLLYECEVESLLQLGRVWEFSIDSTKGFLKWNLYAF